MRNEIEKKKPEGVLSALAAVAKKWNALTEKQRRALTWCSMKDFDTRQLKWR